MKRLAIRLAIGVSAGGLAAVIVPPAAADTITGGCTLAAQPVLTNPTTYAGTISVSSVTRDSSGVPTPALVDCWVEVDGTEQPGTRVSVHGDGSQSGVQQVAFGAIADLSTVNLCKQVFYDDGQDSGEVTCVTATWQDGGLAVTAVT